jgi:hypothetical protein
MKKIISRLLLAALVAAPVMAVAGCPAEEPKKEEAPPPPPPPPPPPTIPDYNPEGEHADLKREGAAGIDANNAAARAAEAEANLDKAIAEIEAAKAGAPAK